MATATIIGRRGAYGAVPCGAVPAGVVPFTGSGLIAPPGGGPRQRVGNMAASFGPYGNATHAAALASYGAPGAFVGPSGAVPVVVSPAAWNGGGVGSVAVTRLGAYGAPISKSAAKMSAYVYRNELSDGRVLSDKQLGVTGGSGIATLDWFRWGTSDDATIRAIQRRKAIAKLEAEIRKNLRVSGRQERMTMRVSGQQERMTTSADARAQVKVARAKSNAPTAWDNVLDAGAAGAGAMLDAAGQVLGVGGEQVALIMEPPADVPVVEEEVVAPPPINWYPYIIGGSALLAVIIVAQTSKKKAA